ncbi:ATP-dependent zinc metalloprotease FtsH [Gossypium australe]|uniref:ATP-dependent zinc metalloprotease FtsH n=1 Tax=Gossypium australe TaxID=47621 RepID=A0A5B6X008_9ROSI|nr:ATP-dependent zinc metalloprotease FtsH [Gossypium australe]
MYGVAPNVAEYRLEVVERIMDDLDCTVEQKLKGVVEGIQADRVVWDFFKSAFQGKYVGASYVDVRRKEFLNLVQGYKFVAEYEAEFLRLSWYTRGIVTTEYERCVRFEDGLQDELRVLIAVQRERDFAALVEKAKIAEDVKRSERQNREQDKGRSKRNFWPSSSFGGPKKRPRFDGPARAKVSTIVVRPQPCADCGRSHLGECWK